MEDLPPVKFKGPHKTEAEKRFEKVKQEKGDSKREMFLSTLNDKQKRILQLYEYQKTIIETEMIALAVDFVNGLRQKFGLEPVSFDDSQLVILPEEYFNEIYESNGTMVTQGNTLTIGTKTGHRRDETGKQFGILFSHELTHLFAPRVFYSGQEESSNYHQTGVSLYGREQIDSDQAIRYEYFKGLHEVMAMLVQSRFAQLLLKREKTSFDRLNTVKEHIDFTKAKGDLTETLTYFEDEDNWSNISDTYQGFFRVFKFVADVIAEEQSVKIKNIENMFLKAHFTGRLLPIARLVEKSFGEGSFRLLGEMQNEQSVATTMRGLKRMKSQRLKLLAS